MLDDGDYFAYEWVIRRKEVHCLQDLTLHQQAEVSPGPGIHFAQELLKPHSSPEGVCPGHMDLSSPLIPSVLEGFSQLSVRPP